MNHVMQSVLLRWCATNLEIQSAISVDVSFR
jgi:hypothetical protein